MPSFHRAPPLAGLLRVTESQCRSRAMKRTIATNAEAVVSNESIRMAIACLDSPTNYQEFIPPEGDQPATSYRRANTRTSNDGNLWLLLVPVLVIVLAVIAAMAR